MPSRASDTPRRSPREAPELGSDVTTSTDGGSEASSVTVPDGSAETDAASDAASDAAAADPCATKTPVCPTTTTTAGSGVVAIDRCAFPIEEATTSSSLPPLVTALEKLAPKASTAAILADLNRTATAATAGLVPGAPPGVDVAVRLAFVDVTNPQAPTYRFALLVEPTGTPQAPSFVPVTIHAGGLAWFGNYLYVVETGRGFRVFDMTRAMQVATDVDQIGCQAGVCRAGLYKYVVPQVGGYTSTKACAPLFSYVALDRSTTPPSLLSGEYCGGTACASQPLSGRAYRWPLDATTGRIGAKTSWPSEAMLLGQTQVQGGASRKGVYYLSSSAPAGGGGALYRMRTGKSATSTWLDSPEDLMVDEANGPLWSLSEAAGKRVVAGMKLTSYPAP